MAGKGKNKNKNKPATKTVAEAPIVTETFETFEEKFTIKDFDEKKAFLVDLEKSISSSKSELQKERLSIDKQSEFLSSKELELNTKLASLDADIANIKTDKINSLDTEISNLRLTKIENLNTEFEKERTLRIDNLNNEINSTKEKLAVESETFEKVKLEFSQELSKFKIQQNSYELDCRILEENKASQDYEIQNKIDAGIREITETLTSELDSKNQHLNELRSSLSQNTLVLEKYKTAYSQLGDDPIFILDKITALETENLNLKNELANSPAKELTEEYAQLIARYDDLQVKFEDIQNLYKNTLLELQNNEFYRLKFENANHELNHQKNISTELESQILYLQSTITRLTSNNGVNIDREALIRDISRPIINTDELNLDATQPISEIDWLDSIQDSCSDYEIVFPKRILYAFHTALKISDWSQITVLAGVSGTGKSELPKLYCAFGGINFISVAVQPNWDSQDDMLGHFNSIDNKFDAQPLLRFLVQSTDQLKDYLSIVLLDEMNLSHVENYFSDFLSKLEERRGKMNKDLPNIEIKLGAGIEPYPLKLRRNIMWSGTMNQDETTKSLSDKVVDRGIIINFPRPTTFNSRESMQPLTIKKDLLSYDTWAGTREKEGWVKRKLGFSEDQLVEINRLKEITEKINKYLSTVNCALGHRIWNQIEFYIRNYPTVSSIVTYEEDLTDDLKKAMHIAFEDQIVQKIMPKLRGVETHFTNMECCFNKIIDLLEKEGFNLTKDIENACNAGFGSFIWSSSEYLKEE